jgi:D-amino peptidase
MPRRTARKQLKIYVSTDLEGVSGVYCFKQTRESGTPLAVQAAEYLMGDIAALVRGLRAGGATEVVVADGHGGGGNFIPHLMAPGATYSCGVGRPPFVGLDEDCAGVVLLGFHAMCGTPDGVLHHTQSSRTETRYWYNGVESGEIMQMALVTGDLGVPIIMVTGDVATCREARKFLGPAVVTVPTKRGIGRESAFLYPFAEVHQAIFAGAQKALAAIGRCKPYQVKLPIKCRREIGRASCRERVS